jgi:hypothetical protein
MNFPRVCIPSYNRSDTINLKSLKFLKSVDYPTDKIYIFVANEMEKIKYSQSCDGYHIILGVPGLLAQLRFIQDFLDDGEIYIRMDDDVNGIKSLKPFFEIIRNAIERIESGHTGLWGVLPNDDARRFKDNTTQHLSFIIGAFFVSRNHKDIYLEGLTETEDYERTIRYYLRYKSVCRYRGAGVSTKYLGTSGGTTDIIKKKEAAVQKMVEQFPNLCKRKDKKGIPDLELNWRAD